MSSPTARTDAYESPWQNPRVRYGAILVIGLLLGVVIGVGLSEFVLQGTLCDDGQYDTLCRPGTNP